MNLLRSISYYLIGGKRLLHHSSTQGRFYTNRFYVKKCKKCMSMNNLSLVKCFNCSNTLSDSDIRLRSLDHICEVSNSRKRLVDSVYEKEGNNGLNTNTNALQTAPASILYRSFEFTIMMNPRPSAFIHLSAFPNGTFYDIKNFRKSHVPMITKMSNMCLEVLKDILSGKIDIYSEHEKESENKNEKNYLEFARVQNDVNSQLEEKLSKDQRKYILTEQMKMIKKELGMDSDDKSNVIEFIKKSAIFGFNYPNKHSHVDMHAILPPINCFNIFKSPFYYPLDKVLSDLNNFGRVRPYSPLQMRNMNEFDEVIDNIKQIDRSFRGYFSL